MENMFLPCTLKVRDDLSLTFHLHGMEPELPIEIDDLSNMQHDPRYPSWDKQFEHHKKLNDMSRQARIQYWGCEDRSVIEYFLRLSDSIGAHLEDTGRKFWTQEGKYSHSYCEHIL